MLRDQLMYPKLHNSYTVKLELESLMTELTLHPVSYSASLKSVTVKAIHEQQKTTGYM